MPSRGGGGGGGGRGAAGAARGAAGQVGTKLGITPVGRVAPHQVHVRSFHGTEADYSLDQYIGQIQDMGNRFRVFLDWLRAQTVRLTRGTYGILPDYGYTPPPQYNDYLPTVPYSGPIEQDFPRTPKAAHLLWFFPRPLVLQQTSTQNPNMSTTGVVSQNMQPEVPDIDPWTLSAHGYYEGLSVTG